MNVAKFLDFLKTGELHLARADQMSDNWEGAYGSYNKAMRPQVYGENYSSLVHHFPMVAAYGRTHVYLNCWHISEVESAAMWGLYDPAGQGVAIKAKKADLLASLVGSQRVRGFPISYTDYSDKWVSEGNVYVPYMFKRTSFQHEREYRLLAGKLEAGQSSPFLREKIDCSRLAGEVFVAPTASGWFREVLKDVMERYGISWPVHHSNLADGPVY